MSDKQSEMVQELWDIVNERRLFLINMKLSDLITCSEHAELIRLQAVAAKYADSVAPIDDSKITAALARLGVKKIPVQQEVLTY